MSANNVRVVVKDFPRERLLITDPLDAARTKNIVPGVFEFEITRFRKESKENHVSFLSRILFAISRAAEKNRIVNSYREGNKLVEFADVDICVAVERETKNTKLPLPYIIRNANRKTLQEIDTELKLAKNGDLDTLYLHQHMRLYLSLPKFIRVLFWKYILKRPRQFKARLGTIGVSPLHSKGYGLVHFDALSPYTLTIALGRISKNEHGEESIFITFSMDHDVMDGVSLIKFSSAFASS